MRIFCRAVPSWINEEQDDSMAPSSLFGTSNARKSEGNLRNLLPSPLSTNETEGAYLHVHVCMLACLPLAYLLVKMKGVRGTSVCVD